MAKRSARRTRRRGGFWPFTSDSSQPTRTWGQWWRGEPASAPVSPTPPPATTSSLYGTSSTPTSSPVMGGKKRGKTRRGGSRRSRAKHIYGH